MRGEGKKKVRGLTWVFASLYILWVDKVQFVGYQDYLGLIVLDYTHRPMKNNVRFHMVVNYFPFSLFYFRVEKGEKKKKKKKSEQEREREKKREKIGQQRKNKNKKITRGSA